MTKERYEVILGELADVLRQKNETIVLQGWQIEDLRIKLAEAEQHKKKGGEPAVEIKL